jgi:hypothetical protein
MNGIYWKNFWENTFKAAFSVISRMEEVVWNARQMEDIINKYFFHRGSAQDLIGDKDEVWIVFVVCSDKRLLR